MNPAPAKRREGKTPRDALVFTFDDGERSIDFAATELGFKHPSEVIEIITIPPNNVQDCARLADVALQSFEVKHLVCIGAGAGGLAAMAAGRQLGAHAVLAIAPTIGLESLDTAALDTTFRSLCDAAELEWPGQTVDLVQTTDSAELDQAFAARLSAAGVTVRLGHSNLPSRLLPLAMRHSRWLPKWLTDYPLEPANLSSAWLATFNYGIEVDLDDMDFASPANLSIHLNIRNRGEEPIDFAAAAADGVHLGLRRERPPAANAAAEASSQLPSLRLQPGEAMFVEMRPPPLTAADAFGIGLVWRQNVWLEDFGFSAVRLASQPVPSGESRFRTAADPIRRPAASRRIRPLGHQAATREDVERAYRSFLGREVESERVISDHLAGGPDLWSVVDRVMSSREAVRWRIHESLGQLANEPSEGVISLHPTADQSACLVRHVETVWAQAGREQPYFSTLANPDYRLDRLTPEALETFYATGEAEVAALEATCRRSGIDLPVAGSVLELGCRVGRVGVALAKRFDHYTGVDISPDQLACAQAQAAAQNALSARWVRYDAWRAEAREYDVLFSVLALQHLPPPVMLSWLESGLSHVRPGGLAYVQLPCRLFDYSFDPERFLAGRSPGRPYDLHALPQPVVLASFTRHNFAVLEVQLSPRIGSKGLSYAFLALRQTSPPTPGPRVVGVGE